MQPKEIFSTQTSATSGRFDLYVVNQTLQNGRATLLAKQESIGIIMSIVLDDLNGDGEAEIIIGTDIGVVMAFSPAGEVLWRYANDAIKAIQAVPPLESSGRTRNGNGKQATLLAPGTEMVDINGDGKKEVITLRSERMQAAICVFSENGSLIWQYPINSSANALVCSDIDNDGAYEIVTGGYDLTVLSHTGEVKWVYASDAAHQVFASDINGDGKSEIIAGSRRVVAYNEDGKALWHCETGPLWSLGVQPPHKRTSCQLVSQEATIVAISQEGQLYLLDGNGNLEHQQAFHLSSAENLIVDDIDGDGVQEVLIASFLATTELFDISGTQRWRFQPSMGPRVPSCITTGVLNREQKKSILAAFPHGLWVLDEEGEVQWHYLFFPDDKRGREPNLWGERHDKQLIALTVADLNGDGLNEVIGMSWHKLYCWDSRGGAAVGNRAVA